MSVRVITKVWDSYPGSGTELIILLALADWSDDSGKCWPSIASIGKKARLSPDQARRVTHRLIEAGFVQVLSGRDGGHGSRRYQIQLDKLTPCMDATPASDARGSTAASPPLAAVQGLPLHGCASRTVIDPSLTVRKFSSRKKPEITLKQFLLNCKDNSEQAIPESDPIFDYARAVGLDEEMVAVCWKVFKAGYLPSRKTYRDWREAFRNCVRGNWKKLWYMREGEAAQWTTAGEQARRVSA